MDPRLTSLFVLLIFCCGQITANEKCTTPDADPGECVDVDNCPQLKSALYRIYGQDAIQHMERDVHVNMSTCGWNDERDVRKVCCPTETSADMDTDALSMFGEPEGTFELANPGTCGVTSANDSYSRIVGGFTVKKGQFPWIVALGYDEGNVYYPDWKCGGSLITPNHVLTAAHCALPNLIKVKIGTLNPWAPGYLVGDVIEIHKHEKYDNVTDVFDIAVLKISWRDYYGKPTEFKPSDEARLICLPKEMDMRKKSYEGYFPFVAGWGVMEWNTTDTSTDLLAVQVKIVKQSICRKKYANFKRIKVTNNVMCAGYKTDRLDSCQGDSGGPLMLPHLGPDGLIYYYQIGIVSKGYRCATKGMPAVYTRVGNFIEWINAKINL